MSENSFSGAIPPEFGGIGGTGLLFLSKNVRTVAPVMPRSSHNVFLGIETLKLNGNQLFGQFPDTLGNLISLEVLDIGDNLLTGAIPPVLANYQLLSKLSDWRLIFGNVENQYLRIS